MFSTYLIKFDRFELNQEDIQLVPCPLLYDPVNYIPDLFDLTKDEEARNYWLDCFERTIHTVGFIRFIGLILFIICINSQIV